MHGANMKNDRVHSKQVRVMKFCTIVSVVRHVHSFGLIQENKSIKRHRVSNLKYLSLLMERRMKIRINLPIHNCYFYNCS